jgi:hypothetical protein
MVGDSTLDAKPRWTREDSWPIPVCRGIDCDIVS